MHGACRVEHHQTLDKGEYMNKVETLIAERKSTVEQELQALIVKCNILKRERDEARRMACEKEETLGCDERGVPRNGSARDHAERMGWDCFNTPEGKLDKTMNGVIVDGGKAVPPKYEDLGDE